MSSLRLSVQFEALFEHFCGQDVETQLDEITEILFCTRRNARLVLNKMVAKGWIEWHPAVGRGKSSPLIFKRSRADVSEQLVRRYLDEGKIAQALSVLDQDAGKLTQVIQDYLGVQHQAGQQVIRLPYYRALAMLNPTKAMRRSEQHIAHQIYSGLTRLDENEQLQADLAHSWEAITPCHWRFYLRSGVRFHNGDPLTLETVLDSIWALRQFSLFEHIAKVDSPCAAVIEIQLTKADHRLPLLLAESCAKILPSKKDRAENFDLMPMGTGPYKVVSNDNKRLILHAFDGYFGFRPLIDRVEVWVIEETYSSLVFPSLSHPMVTQPHQLNQEVKLDPGCSYLQLNRCFGLAAQDEWAQYFASRLNSLALFRCLSDEEIAELGILPAYGLKPGWYHHNVRSNLSLPCRTNQSVRVAYQAQHPMFKTLAQVIKTRLNEDGLTVVLVEYEQEMEHLEQIDIWIKAMGIAHHQEEALAGWLLDYSDLKTMSRAQDFADWTGLIDHWRADPNAQFPAHLLGQALVTCQQIVPLFHCWLGVSTDQCGSLQNAKCNALGWFDFSQVWVKPDFAKHKQ